MREAAARQQRGGERRARAGVADDRGRALGVERREIGLGEQPVGHGQRAGRELGLLGGLAHVDDLQLALVGERAHLDQADRLEALVRVRRVDAEADLGELREADGRELARGVLGLLVRRGHDHDLALGVEREPAAVAESRAPRPSR